MLEDAWNSYYLFRESRHTTPLPLQDELDESRFEQNEEVRNVIELVYLQKEPDRILPKSKTRISNNFNCEIR